MRNSNYLFFLILIASILFSCKSKKKTSNYNEVILNSISLNLLFEDDLWIFDNVKKNDNLYEGMSSRIALSDSILLTTDFLNNEKEIVKLWINGTRIENKNELIGTPKHSNKTINKLDTSFSYYSLVKKYSLKETTLKQFSSFKSDSIPLKLKKIKNIYKNDSTWNYNEVVKVSRNNTMYQLYLEKDGYYNINIYYKGHTFSYPQKDLKSLYPSTIGLHDITGDGKEELFVFNEEELFGRGIVASKVKIYEILQK